MTDIAQMNVARVSYDNHVIHSPSEPWWPAFRAQLVLGRVANTESLDLIAVEGQRICPVELGVAATVFSVTYGSPNEPLPIPEWTRSVRLVGDAMFLPKTESQRNFNDDPFTLSVVGQEEVAEMLTILANPEQGFRHPHYFFRVLHRLASARLGKIQD